MFCILCVNNKNKVWKGMGIVSSELKIKIPE